MDAINLPRVIVCSRALAGDRTRAVDRKSDAFALLMRRHAMLQLTRLQVRYRAVD